MRNPLRSLVTRPAGTPSLRERLAAKRENFARTLRRGREVEPAPTVSPELMARIAECLSANAVLSAIPDDAMMRHTPHELIRQAGKARSAVALFPAAGPADTWAKARCLAAIYRRDDMQAEIEDDARHGITLDGFAVALAAEVIDLTATADASVRPVPTPDPIFAAIAEAERLRGISDEVYRLPDIGLDPLPEKEEAGEALWNHVLEVVLQTVPTTAAGCVALARFAKAFRDGEGVDPCEDNRALIDLIARSHAL